MVGQWRRDLVRVHQKSSDLLASLSPPLGFGYITFHRLESPCPTTIRWPVKAKSLCSHLGARRTVPCWILPLPCLWFRPPLCILTRHILSLRKIILGLRKTQRTELHALHQQLLDVFLVTICVASLMKLCAWWSTLMPKMAQQKEEAETRTTRLAATDGLIRGENEVSPLIHRHF